MAVTYDQHGIRYDQPVTYEGVVSVRASSVPTVTGQASSVPTVTGQASSVPELS